MDWLKRLFSKKPQPAAPVSPPYPSNLKAGDLAMVVSHPECGCFSTKLGFPFRVIRVSYANHDCGACGKIWPAWNVEESPGFGYTIQQVIKLDNPGEEQTTSHKEEEGQPA